MITNNQYLFFKLNSAMSSDAVTDSTEESIQSNSTGQIETSSQCLQRKLRHVYLFLSSELLFISTMEYMLLNKSGQFYLSFAKIWKEEANGFPNQRKVFDDLRPWCLLTCFVNIWATIDFRIFCSSAKKIVTLYFCGTNWAGSY